MAAKSSVLQHFYKKGQDQRLKDVAEFCNLSEEDLKLLKSDSALVRILHTTRFANALLAC